MITIADAEDVYLRASSEVELVTAQVMHDWYLPIAKMMAGVAAGNLTPEEVQGMPEGGVERIINFVLGGK